MDMVVVLKHRFSVQRAEIERLLVQRLIVQDFFFRHTVSPFLRLLFGGVLNTLLSMLSLLYCEGSVNSLSVLIGKELLQCRTEVSAVWDVRLIFLTLR